MPISNFWLNRGVQAILSVIQELELNASAGGGGSASYRYVTSILDFKLWILDFSLLKRRGLQILDL